MTTLKRVNFSETTSSPEETIALGERIGKMLHSGDVVVLKGDLGAGKTHFTKGLTEGLGGDPGQVSSPTFAIINEYETDNLPIYHFDCYRLEDPREILQIGWEEYLNEDGVCIVEWPEKIKDFIPEYAVEVSIIHVSESERKCNVTFQKN